MRTLASASLALAVLVLSTSCGGSTRRSADGWNAVPRGQLATPGVVLEGDQQSFRIVAGQDFETPFFAYDCPAQPTTQNFALALRLGARRVRVAHPASPGKALYGVLAFCRLAPWAKGPVTRLYNVEVGADHVAETSGGRVSVMWEYSGANKHYSNGMHNLPAWILWLSERPL